MKTVKVISPALASLLFAFLFSGCAKDSGNLFPSTEEVLIKHVWVVDYYFHNQDMTENYSSSSLLFSGTGVVGYRNEAKTTGGKWSKTIDASNDELIDLQFNTTDGNIMELNKSWKLTERTANSLQFEQVDSTSDIIFRIRAH